MPGLRLSTKKGQNMALTEEQERLGKLLAEFRNLRQREAEAIDEFLNYLGASMEGKIWNPNKIKWVQTEGTKGPYERYPAKGEKAESTVDYKAMLEDLKRHNGKLMCGGLFYWLFTDQATVGRKRTKKGNPGVHERMNQSLNRVKAAGKKLTGETKP